MKNLPWLLLVALLAVNVGLVAKWKYLTGSLREARSTAAPALLKARYADEEEALLARIGAVPASFPRLEANGIPEDSVQFLLIVGVSDCTSSIEDEIAKLNQLAAHRSERLAGVRGFFVAESQAAVARRFIQNLSPPPRFPITVENVVQHVPEATTPLVLVIRSGDGRILDAYKPIVEDLTKRDAFYARWFAALGLS